MVRIPSARQTLGQVTKFFCFFSRNGETVEKGVSDEPATSNPNRGVNSCSHGLAPRGRPTGRDNPLDPIAHSMGRPGLAGGVHVCHTNSSRTTERARRESGLY